ncbi:Amino-acid N-acetyltransferase protein [Dioscorea alata]|uniref:Amino-acid N-acetyltransferase protein n=1 Tax=Dioscorea alata TaxID=55571 RepID=A0ACB7VSA2_DIOAL|nr:Amino-acid N-acetyltransferase protein [Dioscorea alata]
MCVTIIVVIVVVVKIWYRFVRRGFKECSVEDIPKERRDRINFSRGSKYYVKQLQRELGGINVNGSARRYYVNIFVNFNVMLLDLSVYYIFG